jgi:hypothetical protein
MRCHAVLPAVVALGSVLVACGTVPATLTAEGRGAAIATTRRPANAAPTGMPATSVPSPEAAARLLAAALLRRIVLPAGARALTHGAVPSLAQPVMIPVTPNVADAAGFWAVPESMAASADFLRANPPRGLVSSGEGSSSTWGVITAESVTTFLPDVPAGVNAAGVNFEVVPGPSAESSLVRVDGYVLWLPVRPLDEVVTSGDGVVVLSRNADAQHEPRVARTITDPVTLAGLRAAFNGLATQLPGVRNCPALFGISYTASFAPLQSAAPDVVATAVGCGAVDVIVRGQPSVVLQDSPDFSTTIAALLGDSRPFAPASMR